MGNKNRKSFLQTLKKGTRNINQRSSQIISNPRTSYLQRRVMFWLLEDEAVG
jgi:hypothetical protein